VSKNEKGTWLSSSFTDLMTSLAVIFLLLLCATFNSVQQESEATRNSMLVELQKSLSDFASGRIEVRSEQKDPLGLLVLVPEDLLAFKLDRADISAEGLAFLHTFIPKLAKTVCSPHFSKEINSVVVEGHTDSSGTSEHNLDLSQRRSLSVARASLRVLDSVPEDGQKSSFLHILSASGRGSADPVTGPTGVEDATLSRRVVFKIRVRSLEQRQLIETLRSQGA
jgi:outer membrane protein OmpA-like peptidoglycan-associated protein